jgi:hypothetical protein
LATTTLTGASTSITFSSIPATYKDLILVISGTSTSGIAETIMRFNSDTATNYSRVTMFGTGSTTGSFAGSATGIGFFDAFTSVGMSIAQIMDYSATDKQKTVLIRRSFPADNVAATGARWANTSAITSVSLAVISSSLAIGTTISLYGVA